MTHSTSVEHIVTVSRAIVFVLSVCVVATSSAQEPGRSDAFERRGLMLGGAIGMSALRIAGPGVTEGTYGAASLPNFKIGAMVSERLAVAVLLPGSIYRYEGQPGADGRRRARGFEGIIPSVQYWTGERSWLLAGAGLTLDAPAFYDIKSDEERTFHTGPSLVLGAGHEMWRSGTLTVDAQSRIHIGRAAMPGADRTGSAFTILVGINRY